MKKSLVYTLAAYDPRDVHWLTLPLINGSNIVLKCGLGDVEGIHAVVREILTRVSAKKLEEECHGG